MNMLLVAKEIRENDAVAEKVGEKIAAVFHLKKDANQPDRWKTVWGNKTNIGVARTMLRLMEEEVTQIQFEAKK